jgi:class 3 adenylate cyclase
MQRRWIVVAFSDILGFGTWRRRASNTPEIAEPFIQRFYDVIEQFIRKNDVDWLYLKYLGDGFMVIKEIFPGKNEKKSVQCFLDKMAFLTSELSKVVRKCEWPTPEGFRTRVVAGHVSKLEVINPNDRKKTVSEYVGYAVNLAQRLLEISPATPFICHESIVKIIGTNNKNIKIKRMGESKERPRGVDPEDITGLWTLKFVNNG